MKTLLLLLALPALAGADEGTARRSLLEANNSVMVGWGGTWLDYHEPSNLSAQAGGSKYFDSERGWTSGDSWRVAASMMRDLGGAKDILIAADFSRALGFVTYDGHAYVGPGGAIIVPVHTRSHADITDTHLRFGKGFQLSDRWMLTPYLSYGYHTWYRVLSPGTNSEYWAYYTDHILQVGNRLQVAPGGGWVCSLDGRFGLTVGSHVHIPSVGLDRALGGAPIVTVEAEVDKALWRGIHAVLGASYTYFSYSESGEQNGFLEPGSLTATWVWNAGLRYSFL